MVWFLMLSLSWQGIWGDKSEGLTRLLAVARLDTGPRVEEELGQGDHRARHHALRVAVDAALGHQPLQVVEDNDHPAPSPGKSGQS